MINKRIMVLAILLVGLLAISAASAAEVNSTDDADSAQDQLELENMDEELDASNDLGSVEVFDGTIFTEL